VPLRPQIREEIEKAIKTVGLTEKLNVLSAKLSGGQKRKLSICIALLGGSRVMFLDEPTSGMDPYSRRSTWQILQNSRAGRVLVRATRRVASAGECTARRYSASATSPRTARRC